MKKKNEQRLTKLAEAAFRQAARKVIERAEASGTPVIIWERETIKAVEPRKVRIPRMARNSNSAEAGPRRKRPFR